MTRTIALLALLQGCPKEQAPAASAEETVPQPSPPTAEELGKLLFFDSSLSEPEGQACAACHGPEVGFTGPDPLLNVPGSVYEGAQPGRFGNRKPPAAAYAGSSPKLHFDEEEGVWIGGMFWDGRATGEVLGDPLAEQAQGPFLNPLEHNLPDAAALCAKLSSAPYAERFRLLHGAQSLDCATNAEEAYAHIGRDIAAFERSAEVNPFSSRYDAWLAGTEQLSEQELAGLALFEGKALCADCHPSRPDEQGDPPLFTDFTYDNLGLPKNPENPFYAMSAEFNPQGQAWIDEGLGGALREADHPEEVWQAELGKVKVPTLRNVDRRPDADFAKAFGHNGTFHSLAAIVHFYNTRDTKPACKDEEENQDCWHPPEVPTTVNRDELGDLGLTPEEEAAIVTFLATLSDR